ncbi:MAG TPA: protein kinase [Polyangia bacterium]|nr:protein kinase [Polyangia bacterium]
MQPADIPGDSAAPAGDKDAPDAHPPGLTIGRYRLQHRLGQGGVGAVYAAWDPQLGRQVAIKLLRPEATGRAAEKARMRLLREAQVIARLSHPHVITVYDVGVHQDEVFVVMELVDGGTLKTWLAGGRRSWREILDVFLAAGRGLAAAHAAGVVHRDFKPDNVLIGKDGRVRVADFGLARDTSAAEEALAPAEGTEGPPQPAAGTREPARELARDKDAGAWPETNTEPVSLPLTQTGALVGTPTYMAPEQFLSGTVDARTDQFSFCVTLYRALYDEFPFGRGSARELAPRVVGGMLRPPPRKTSVPRWIAPVVVRGLATRAEDRFPSLEALLEALDPRRHDPWRHWRVGAATLVLLFGVAVALAPGVRKLWRGRGPEWPPRGVPLRQKLTTAGDVTEAAISSDGKSLAYVRDGRQLLIRDLATGEEREAFRASGISRLGWAPSSNDLLFSVRSDRETSGHWLLSSTGTRRLGLDSLTAWAPNGQEIAHASVAVKNISLTRVADGATRSIPLQGTYDWITDIDWSPSGNRLLVETQSNDRHTDGRHTVWSLSIDRHEQERIVEEAYPSSPRWSRREDAFYYLHSSGSSVDLMKASVTPLGQEASRPMVLLAGLDIGPSDVVRAFLSFSRDGRQLVYTKTARYKNLWLVTVETQGARRVPKTMRLTSGTSDKLLPSLSPDSRTVAFAAVEGRSQNLFTMPITGGSARRLTRFHTPGVWIGISAWSPDGREIAFPSNVEGRPQVWHVAAMGGEPRAFAQSEVSYNPQSLTWAPGELILYQRPGNRNYHLLGPRTEEERPLIVNRASEAEGWIFYSRYSPDGTRVVANWNRKKEGGAGLWILSLVDGSERNLAPAPELLKPIGWSADGQWIYVQHESQRQGVTELLRISVASGASEPWVTLPFAQSSDCTGMTPDGRRFVCAVSEGDSDAWLVEGFDDVPPGG